MNERAKQLLGELFEEMTGAKMPKYANGEPPTTHTRGKLNETREMLSAVVSMSTLENEFLTADVKAVDDQVFKELTNAEAQLGTPGADMSWQEVRGLYAKWFQMAADCLTPEGVAKRLAALKAQAEANIATPVANAAKAGLYDALMNKFSPK